NSRSWAQWTAPPPIATDTHRDAPAPIERHAHGLQAKICCSCSWLHFLKSWSLLKTRGDSFRLCLKTRRRRDRIELPRNSFRIERNCQRRSKTDPLSSESSE